jgi:CheY-like chemotaxis protein
MDLFGPKKPRVLIADANAESRTDLYDLFDDAGWDVVLAKDGRDALVKALARPPSLLVTDTELGFINGLQLCEVLRDDHGTRHVPIIVIASPAGVDIVARATNAGARLVLEKPPAVEVLLKHATDLVRVGHWRYWRPRRRRPRVSR